MKMALRALLLMLAVMIGTGLCMEVRRCRSEADALRLLLAKYPESTVVREGAFDTEGSWLSLTVTEVRRCLGILPVYGITFNSLQWNETLDERLLSPFSSLRKVALNPHHSLNALKFGELPSLDVTPLSRLSQLESIASSIELRNLASLAECSSLRRLKLYERCDVAKLTRLNSRYLRWMTVSGPKEEWMAARKALPNCHVEWNAFPWVE